MSNSNGKEIPPKPLGFGRTLEQEKESLYLLTSAEQEINRFLALLKEMQKLIGIQKMTKKVKDFEKKMDQLNKKIEEYLNPKKGASLEQPALGSRRSSGGPNVEEHPLLDPMTGLPPDVLSPEWNDELSEVAADEKLQDKAELENKLKNRLKAKHELVAKLKNELKIAAKARPTPGMKRANELVVQYTKTLDNKIKHVLKPEPEAPAPRPERPPPRPSPFSGG